MNSLLLLLLPGLWLSLGASALASPAPLMEVVTEARLDLRRLYDSYTPVSPATYDVPADLQKTYVFRTTYAIPAGLEAESQLRHVPESEDCGEYSCTTIPAHFREELKFEHPSMHARIELFDEDGKSYGAYLRPLRLETVQISEGPQPLPLKTARDLETAMKFPGSDTLHFPLFPDGSRNRMTIIESSPVSKRPFEDGQLLLEKLENGNYRVRGAQLDPSSLQTPALLNPSLNADYSRYGFYLGIGEPGGTSPFSRVRVTKSHVN